MLSFADLAVRPDFTVTAVTCADDRTGWSEVESADDYRVVLVSRGRFRRRTNGVLTEVDPTLAYVGVPGEEEHFAHPAGGDVCTLVALTPELWRTLAGDAARMTTSTVYIDPRLDLTHRRLLAAAHTGDVDFDVAERLLGLLKRVVDQVVSGPTPLGAGSSRASSTGFARASSRASSTASSTADRALVAEARRAIGEDHPAASGLVALAELLEVSPYRLSRAFTRELGVSLTRYRNRVRLGRALDRLEEGEPSLAALAAELGFADQAHLSRTMSEHLGHTPTALRRLLAQPA